MKNITTLEQAFKEHDVQDSKRHRDNLRRFEKQEKATLAIHKRMGDLATKEDLNEAKGATGDHINDLARTIGELTDQTKASIEAEKAVRYGISFLSISGRTVVLIGAVIAALITILGGWKTLLGYVSMKP